MDEGENDAGASGMRLDDATRLKQGVERELTAMAVLEARRDELGYSWFGSDLPRRDRVYVVTRDGAHFGVMTFSGEYSGYGESVYWSSDEWGRAMAEARQTYFNPEGAWTQRLVMHVDPPEAPKRPYPNAALECGHTRNAAIHDGPPRLCQVGDRVLCYRCREMGVGLTDELVREGIARAEEALLAESSAAP